MFSIAVFGPIVNEGYVNADSGPELRCVFNGNAGACRFGVALGLGVSLDLYILAILRPFKFNSRFSTMSSGKAARELNFRVVN